VTLRPARCSGSGFAPYVAIASLGAVVTSSLAVLVVTTSPRLARLPATVSAGPLFGLPGQGRVTPVPPAAPAVPPAPLDVAVAVPPAPPAPPPHRAPGRYGRPHPVRPAVPPSPIAAAGSPGPAPRFLRADAPADRYPAVVSVTISDLPYLPDYRTDPAYRYSRARHCRHR
jgi:hypothetical protein